MYKYVYLTLALLAMSMAAPQEQQYNQQQEPQVRIISQESDVGIDGYHFTYETSDGTSRQEQGTLKQISDDVKALEVTGSYKYTAPDGLIYTVTFTADEHGFQPSERVEHPGQDAQQYQQ